MKAKILNYYRLIKICNRRLEKVYAIGGKTLCIYPSTAGPCCFIIIVYYRYKVHDKLLKKPYMHRRMFQHNTIYCTMYILIFDEVFLIRSPPVEALDNDVVVLDIELLPLRRRRVEPLPRYLLRVRARPTL